MSKPVKLMFCPECEDPVVSPRGEAGNADAFPPPVSLKTRWYWGTSFPPLPARPDGVVCVVPALRVI